MDAKFRPVLEVGHSQGRDHNGRYSRVFRANSNLTIIPVRVIRAQSVLTIVTDLVQVSPIESLNSLTTILGVGRKERYLPRMEVPTDGSSARTVYSWGMLVRIPAVNSFGCEKHQFRVGSFPMMDKAIYLCGGEKSAKSIFDQE